MFKDIDLLLHKLMFMMFALPIPVSEIEFVTNFLPICRRDKVFFLWHPRWYLWPMVVTSNVAS